VGVYSMKKYYVTVHRDEDHNALQGQDLDAGNSHMVLDAGYDLGEMRDIIKHHPWKIIWQMEPSKSAKFGWKFQTLLGIPR